MCIQSLKSKYLFLKKIFGGSNSFIYTDSPRRRANFLSICFQSVFNHVINRKKGVLTISGYQHHPYLTLC